MLNHNLLLAAGAVGFGALDPQLANMLAMAGGASFGAAMPQLAAALAPTATQILHPMTALHLNPIALPAAHPAAPAPAHPAFTPAMHFPQMVPGQASAVNMRDMVPPDLPTGEPGRFEHTPLPIPAVTVGAGATTTISVRPEVRAYRARSLVVPSNIGGNFLIGSVSVGTDNVFASPNGAVSALAFSELAAQQVSFLTRTAYTAQSITISVTNTDAANPHPFQGAFFNGDAWR